MADPPGSSHRYLSRFRAFTISLAAAGALAHLAVLAGLFVLRIGYPFDIEWLEGGMLTHAHRLRQGLPIYGAPTAEFIPFNYTPLEPWLVAALSRLLFIPVGYPLGRALSIAACVAAGWAIVSVVRREGGGRWEALCALGVAAAGFAFAGAWFDLVRADSVCLALAICGFAVLRIRGEHWQGVAFGAALLSLSFFAKQSAGVFVAAGAVALGFVRGRLVPLYLAVSGGLIGAGCAYLQWRSDGWFRRWVFEVPAGHAIEREVLFGRAWERMADQFWPVALLVLGALVVARRRTERQRGLLFWLVFGGACLVASALGASIRLAYLNAYLPAVAAAAVLAGVSAAMLRESSRRIAQLGVPALLLLQLAISAYDPRPHGPGPNRERARRFEARLESLTGDVLVPYHPFAAVQAGKAPSYHAMAASAARHGGIEGAKDLTHAIATQRYAAIVLDRPPERSYWQTYKLGAFLHQDESPHSLTGFDVRPRYLLVPRRPEPPEPGRRAVLDFENATWEGWQIVGDAFGAAPNGGPARFQPPVGPFSGLYFADSGNPTARATGRVLSPEFEILGSPLRLWIGGAKSEGIAARLVVDGQAVHISAGRGDDELRPVDWEVDDLVGRRARLELIDEDPDGYLLADDLTAPLR